MEDKAQEVRIVYPRRRKMTMGSLGVNVFRKTRPWVPAWWSAALPGFGHIYLGMYVKGFILMAGEIGLNLTSHINLVILYTFTGQWQRIHQVMNYEAALPYCAVFTFAIWDSCRLSVEVNKHAFLESKQMKRDLLQSKVTSVELNILDKRVPWVAAVWAGIFPGLGHVYGHRIISGFIMMGWYMAIVFQSHVSQLFICTVTGQFDKIPHLVNYEWLLFFPSISLFAIYDAYNNAITQNQLFRDEQLDYLKNKYGANPIRLQ